MSKYNELSKERKEKQRSGEVPTFMATAGYSMFVQKYTVDNQTVRQRYETIANTAGSIADELYPREDGMSWSSKFFETIWKGWISPATPVLANLGTTRGLPVSCMGAYVDDSIEGFYDTLKEAAILSKHGFGTSAYLSDIRPRGAKFSDNGKANGVVPVFEDFVIMAGKISQGSSRRGSWAGYLDIDHSDFWELADLLFNEPGGKNVGWNISQDFIDRLVSGDAEAIKRYQRVLKIRAVLGKGYINKVDTINEQQTESYKKNGLKHKASNLCNEISLFSDPDHTYTCVLSSLNLSKYDEWKNTDTAFVAAVFLDAVAEEFLRQAREIPGMERAVRYTEKCRSLGVGVMGYHSYLQQNEIPFESEEARTLNREIFSQISKETNNASVWMGQVAGIPEWCVGRRNSHTMAIAPTMSTALIVGGTSQGIEPFVANVWNQTSAAGEAVRINPNLLKIMKDRGVYSDETIDDIINHQGSVQHVQWLDDRLKAVYKTAYEIDQNAIVEQASDRQVFVDQGQSLNLFFGADATPKEISAVHRKALLDPHIKGLYYMRSQAGVQASKKNQKIGGTQ